MRRKGLDKLYDRLAPEERFRLDVEATARGDEEESRRLTEGCPRHSYTLNDIGFSWRWEAARTLTIVMLLDLNQQVSKLRMIDALRSVLPYSTALAQNDAYLAYSDGRKAGSRHAWKKAGMKGEPPGWGKSKRRPERTANSRWRRTCRPLRRAWRSRPTSSPNC
jgi:hypothetical protein